MTRQSTFVAVNMPAFDVFAGIELSELDGTNEHTQSCGICFALRGGTCDVVIMLHFHAHISPHIVT